ncbi:MAG TPA: DUF4870 domain-containing protein [Ignavibacteria bacterium]|nr:DUF4870 domain-containing protein [Ignavibacteria bacterium]
MEQQQETNLTSDEKLLSMLCHLSLFFGGLVIPIVIYFIQKGKSKFVAFNALETIYFHIFYIVVVFVAAFVITIVVSIGAMASTTSRNDMSPLAIILIAAAALFIFAIVIYFIILAIIASIKSYQGIIKKYPIVGNMAYRQVYGN